MFCTLVLCLQGRPFDFEDGDVYMSSHEHRFRMFSSVEYEGQLYMTPQNFIESVTMSEPRSTSHSFYTCLLSLGHWNDWALCWTHQKDWRLLLFVKWHSSLSHFNWAYTRCAIIFYYLGPILTWHKMWFISGLHQSSHWLYPHITLKYLALCIKLILMPHNLTVFIVMYHFLCRFDPNIKIKLCSCSLFNFRHRFHCPKEVFH